MIYKRRNLQQLWEVTVFAGDVEKARKAKKPKTEKLKVIAWNEPDIARKVGDKLAEPAVPLGHVWPDPATGEFLLIEDTSGPTGKKAKADVE